MRALVAAALVLALARTAAAEITLLQIKVVEGEGEVHPAGSRSTRPFTVELTDEAGHPVPGAVISFALPDEGPGGVFANGLRSDVVATDSRGRARLRNIQFNRTPGLFEIRITASRQQVRAGTVSIQYIAETRAGAQARARGGVRHRWLTVALLAAGAAGGGVAAALAGRGGGAAPGAGTQAAAPSLSIGAPTITVGKP
jgi:hypothetical protein